ncbi:MAG: class I SAM-dependent methyltransferase, partial [Dongiaceae bacterium]
LRCVYYPINRFKYRQYEHALEHGSATDIFTRIYEGKLWRGGKSVSGSGSTLESTERLRQSLPEVFRTFSIRSLFDAPCGEFSWMERVVSGSGIQYLGADIVPALVAKNRERCRSSNVKFVIANICTDPFPKADLWFCRDCLFHLSYKDIYLALERFMESDIPLILTTTHINDTKFENSDIRTGRYRRIDLFAEPFQLSEDVKFRIPDWVSPAAPREMCLWTRKQIVPVLPKMKQKVGL